MKREIFASDLLDNEGLHGLVLLGVGEGEELLLVQPPVSATIRSQEQVSGTSFLYSLLITILPRTEIRKVLLNQSITLKVGAYKAHAAQWTNYL